MPRRWVCGTASRFLILLACHGVFSFTSNHRPRIPRIHQTAGSRLHDKHGLATTREDSVESSTRTTADVGLPNEAFRDTKQGELSIVSCNLLAPFYNSLAVDDPSDRRDFADQDRKTRIPLAMEFAKKHNADILILQEVEGGPLHEPQLRHLLQQPGANGHEGYDLFLWSPLLPHRPEDVVGLCVTWRSKRHRLAASDGFRLGGR